MASQLGFKPRTLALEERCSDSLSYWEKTFGNYLHKNINYEKLKFYIILLIESIIIMSDLLFCK